METPLQILQRREHVRILGAMFNSQLAAPLARIFWLGGGFSVGHLRPTRPHFASTYFCRKLSFCLFFGVELPHQSLLRIAFRFLRSQSYTSLRCPTPSCLSSSLDLFVTLATSATAPQGKRMIIRSTTSNTQYECIKASGKGSFGVVYKATNLNTGEVVAIKRVLQDRRYKVRYLLADLFVSTVSRYSLWGLSRGVLTFICICYFLLYFFTRTHRLAQNRELQIMKMLNHTNICKLRDNFHEHTKVRLLRFFGVLPNLALARCRRESS